MDKPPPTPGRGIPRAAGVTEDSRKQSRNDAYAALLQSALTGSAPPVFIYQDVFTEDTGSDEVQESGFQDLDHRRHQEGTPSKEQLRVPVANKDSGRTKNEASEPPTSKAMQFIHKVQVCR